MIIALGGYNFSSDIKTNLPSIFLLSCWYNDNIIQF